MKYLLVVGALVIGFLTGCGSPKPVGEPSCWRITKVNQHGAHGFQYYLSLKKPDGRKGYLDTTIFRPYGIGDMVCIQKFDDGGISSVQYQPVGE